MADEPCPAEVAKSIWRAWLMSPALQRCTGRAHCSAVCRVLSCALAHSWAHSWAHSELQIGDSVDSGLLTPQEPQDPQAAVKQGWLALCACFPSEQGHSNADDAVPSFRRNRGCAVPLRVPARPLLRTRARRYPAPLAVLGRDSCWLAPLTFSAPFFSPFSASLSVQTIPLSPQGALGFAWPGPARQSIT